MNTSAKNAFMNELECFIESAEKNIASVLSTLGWTTEHIWEKNDDNVAACPFDASHRMPSDSLDEHIKSCSLRNQGYSRDEIARQPPDPSFCYEQCTNVVTVPIDEHILKSILGSGDRQKYTNAIPYFHKTVRALFVAVLYPHIHIKTNGKCAAGVPQAESGVTSGLSCEERLAVYDYVVAKGKAVFKECGFSLDDMNLSFEKRSESQKPKSRLELLAEERDYKRRRQSYRAKNVHITKKSYTELTREVIEQQMEYLIPAKTNVLVSKSERDDRSSHSPSHVTNDDLEGRHRGSSRDSGYKRTRRSRSSSYGHDKRPSPISSSARDRAKEKDRHKRSRSHRRDREDNSDSPLRHSRSHKKHKHKHKHGRHRSRHCSSPRD